MSMPSPEFRRSEWMSDLEEIADLAAEMVVPTEGPEARTRRRTYSPLRLVSLLSAAAAPAAGAAETAPEPAEVAPPADEPEPEPEPVPVVAAAAVPVFIPRAASAPKASPVPVQAGRRLPKRRRLLGTTLALTGASVVCAGVLLHLPSTDSPPLTGGPAYSTPSPYASDGGSGGGSGLGGGVALAPVQLTPSTPVPLLSPAPLSSPAPGAGAVRAPARGTAQAPSSGVAQAPVVLSPQPPPGSAPPPPGHSQPGTPAPTPVPTVAPTSAPTAAPSPTPTPAPSAPVAVKSATLSMGTCQDHGSYWLCPETATFTFAPGAAGTLAFSITGTDVDCTGAASAFDQAQKTVSLPAGTTRATVTSALIFPAGSHPAAAGPAGPASTAQIEVTSPNRLTSASQRFGSASCP